ncbi:MAG: alkaline phosphatase family protein [Solirubrobacteraceae bacterium]
MPSGLPSSRRPTRLIYALVALLTAAIVAAPAQADVGLAPGKIKHVWLIILENKSYDSTFTGLNRNTYLWRTLPAQGVLLKNYHGTGHGSLDNYTTLVSGQATEPDLQVDCPYYNKFAGHVDRSGSLRRNPNYGQMTSAKGPNAAAGSNGCVYPASVPTLFKQLDAAHVSWKGYAQDLGNPDGGGPPHNAGVRYCGAPYRKPGRTGTTKQPNAAAATATDQYLPKHFPFPWFDSVLRSGDCNARHIANLFSPRNGLYHDLQRPSRTPAFNWITPNMCSDAHDAVCHGNNLSGGFQGPTRIRPPRNYTGGLYAADLFLKHIIPEIEASAAFKDGGLIDITFDEAFPPFTFTGNSFANSTIVAPNAKTSLANDSAAQTLFGRRVHFEPPGPNTPLARDSRGNALFPGPGNNLFLDRPSSCVQQTVPSQPRGTCLLGAAQHVPGPRTDTGASAPAGSATIDDNNAVITDQGRSVSGPGLPAGAFVGTVTNSFVHAQAPVQNGGFVDTGEFTLVDSSRHPLHTTGAVNGVTLGARTPATDPLFDATHSTMGGGDTGSVLISPYIRPGSVSTGFYNHYSWLRTIEDLFNVRWASRGLDGLGHIGYAAQRGLAPFGRDVFNRPGGRPVPRASHDGGIPSWLRAVTPRLTAVRRASLRAPVLATQGDTVAVDVGRAELRATAVGPKVPAASGLSATAGDAVSGTFVVTLAGGARPVTLAPAAFTVVDEFGMLHHPEVSAAGGGAVPGQLRPGQRLTLVVRDVLPVGNGRLQWSPAGGRPVVAWDFDLELS